MKVTVRAAELATLLDQAPDGLRYLSLDCFDTLVWRNVQAPRDVFADLPIAGGGVGPRMWAEQRARKSAKFSERRNEVSIEEIYHRMRSEEHTSELQSLMRISYAVFCLKK